MTKKTKKNKLQGKTSQKGITFLFLASTCLILLLTHWNSGPSQGESFSIRAAFAESLTGLPIEIIDDAWKNGGFSVYLWGSKKEKHSFAKGYSTRFGQMSFNADAYLKHRKGWSEEKIHSLGFQYGFSDKW